MSGILAGAAGTLGMAGPLCLGFSVSLHVVVGLSVCASVRRSDFIHARSGIPRLYRKKLLGHLQPLA